MPSPKYITEPTQQQLNIRQAYLDSCIEKKKAMDAIMGSSHVPCIRYQHAVKAHREALEALKDCKFPNRICVSMKREGKYLTEHNK